MIEKITPETYEKMNEEFEEEGLAFCNQSLARVCALASFSAQIISSRGTCSLLAIQRQIDSSLRRYLVESMLLP